MQDAPAHPPRIFNDICAPSGLTDDQKLALYTNLIRDGTMDIDSTVAPVDDQILFLARSAFCERIVIAVWITYAEKHGINDPVAMRVLSIAYDRAGVPIFKTLLQTDTFVAWPEQKRMATIRAIIDTVVSSTNTENVYSVDQTIRDIRILAKMIQLVAPFVNGHFAPPTSCMGHLLVAYTCTPFEQREKYATLFNAQALTAAKQLVVPVFTNTSISPSTRRTFIAAAAVLRKTPTGFLTPFFIDIIDAVAPASACMAAMADIFSAIPYTEQRVLPVQWDALFNIEHTHVPITSRWVFITHAYNVSNHPPKTLVPALERTGARSVALQIHQNTVCIPGRGTLSAHRRWRS